jgi:hypothetical protein
MTEYQQIRQELKSRTRSQKHFTKAFYTMFDECQKQHRRNLEAGTPNRYTKNGIILTHDFDPIYKSDFYNLNSGTYCEFLAIYHERSIKA